ncbi:MAG: type II toxin-antitoxin system HicB family antitoxin [Candidatus Dormibacteraeota bacterium]|jgi:predicted RNase H-like HicB family nuclease|nr:type II toxin-antitoxin system HicB family antitoxin [Candidatus Dormibacteraeota bacterium]
MAVVSPATRRYTVILDPDPDDGGYAVHVPALPGCHTQGDTVPEALAHAEEAIIGYLEALASDGLPLPEEREPAQAITVAVRVPSV